MNSFHTLIILLFAFNFPVFGSQLHKQRSNKGLEQEQETKRRSAAQNNHQANDTQIIEPVDIIADAFHGMKGNPVTKEIIQKRLPFPLQKYIAKLAYGQIRRAEIRESTQFVNEHLHELLPAVSPYYYFDREGKNYCDELYTDYHNAQHKMEYDHPVILGAYDVSFPCAWGPSFTNHTFRNVTRLSEVRGGRLLGPTQVMLVAYSDGSHRLMIAEQDRQKLLNFSPKQRAFLIEMRKRKYAHGAGGMVFPYKKLTPKEREILESFDEDIQKKLIRRYGINNQVACLPNSVLRTAVKAADYMVEHIVYILALIVAVNCYRAFNSI